MSVLLVEDDDGDALLVEDLLEGSRAPVTLHRAISLVVRQIDEFFVSVVKLPHRSD
jgi:hypothetical protein